MKGIKTLVSATAIAVCMGAASMASAVTITSPAAGSAFTAPGTITVKSPASFNLPVTCNITFTGNVSSDSKTASITGATVSGSNSLCSVPVMQNLPWTLTPTSTTAAKVAGVSFKIVSNCGTADVTVAYTGGVLSLSPTPQSVGSCSITALSVTPSPTFVIQ
ncbi:alkane oxidation protein activator PraB [Pseudomonas asplenii]|uniref:alkane oxidation protein activator PraB n=1 Tax=Pseudomonas asplenii TaxID=53407 RepID=UPI002363028E|nr:alkane oxidation protein activator PraB [Pseudomonas asplenii]